MSEHSPEPWVANECGADEFFICEESPPGETGKDTGWGKQIGEVDGKANARRIVACVNACKGFSTEELEYLMAHDGTLAPFYLAPPMAGKSHEPT